MYRLYKFSHMDYVREEQRLPAGLASTENVQDVLVVSLSDIRWREGEREGRN